MLLKVLLLLSFILNGYLVFWFVKHSYTIEAHSRLMRDSFVLSQFVNSSISKDELLSIAKSKIGIKKVKEQYNNQSWDDKKFASSVIIEGISFFFNDKDELMQVDHWYKECSPLWVRTF
ncbi:hypothetical protein [Shewanella sp. Koi 1]